MVLLFIRFFVEHPRDDVRVTQIREKSHKAEKTPENDEKVRINGYAYVIKYVIMIILFGSMGNVF